MNSNKCDQKDKRMAKRKKDGWWEKRKKAK